MYTVQCIIYEFSSSKECKRPIIALRVVRLNDFYFIFNAADCALRFAIGSCAQTVLFSVVAVIDVVIVI